MSAPGRRNDDDHIALVIEGGGMRGVTAGGMVSALEDLGLTRCFDSVHGSSAGAAAGAYFVTGQAKLGTRLFYEDLNDGNFIGIRKLLVGKPLMDPSYLVDFAMMERKPFDFPALAASPVKLHVICTDIDRGEPYEISQFQDYPAYRKLLKASITMPLISGREQLIDGRRLLDGGLLQQIAIESAVQAGATHIVTLVTRRDDEMIRELPTWRTSVEARCLQIMYGGKLGELYYNRNHTINAQVEQIKAQRSIEGVPIVSIGIPDAVNYIHRLTSDATLLEKAAGEAYRYTLGKFASVN
jgi:predicted patatin/cPLA2 family phospholipase